MVQFFFCLLLLPFYLPFCSLFCFLFLHLHFSPSSAYETHARMIWVCAKEEWGLDLLVCVLYVVRKSSLAWLLLASYCCLLRGVCDDEQGSTIFILHCQQTQEIHVLHAIELGLAALHTQSLACIRLLLVSEFCSHSSFQR